MRLPRHNHLNGTFRVGEQALQPGKVADEQRGALVRREAPRTPDRQCRRHQRIAPAAAPTHEIQQLPAKERVNLPELVVVDVGQRTPGYRLGEVAQPLCRQITVVKAFHGGRQP